MDVETALQRHGLTGERLLGIARDVANTTARQLPYVSSQLREDLVSFLVEQGLAAAARYDPAKSGSDYSFPSYLWDLLALRTTDFFRRKSEGFGDRRSNSHDRLVLTADPTKDDNTGLWHDNPFEATPFTAARELAKRLSPEHAWTLEHLAARIA